jgi:hypothetical protein
MAEYTPRPWYVDTTVALGPYNILTGAADWPQTKTIVCSFPGPRRLDRNDRPRLDADAHLIAAAPDLLVACLAFHEAMDTIDDRRRDRRLIAAEKLAKAAIVRAGGRIIGPD